MDPGIAWPAVALILALVAVNLAYALGMVKGAACGTKLGKAIGRFEKVSRARDFASSIGKN
jgi:hypothetical protein